MHRVKVHYYFDRDSDREVYSPFSEHSGDPSDDELALNMVVGGLYYSLSKSVIKKHPDCYFAKALTDKGDASGPLTIDRDGKLFKHIQNYLNFRSVNYLLRSIGWVVRIREEACHYNLPGLVKICNKEIRTKLFRWGIYTLPSLNVLQALNDGNEVKRVLLSHVHHSSVAGNVDVSHISGNFYTTLVKHKIQASSIVKRREYHENCPEFFLETSAATKPSLSGSDYSAVLAIMDNIPLLPNVFMCVDSPIVMRVGPGTSIDKIQMPERCVSQMGCAYCILQVIYKAANLYVLANFFVLYLIILFFKFTCRRLKLAVPSRRHPGRDYSHPHQGWRVRVVPARRRIRDGASDQRRTHSAILCGAQRRAV